MTVAWRSGELARLLGSSQSGTRKWKDRYIEPFVRGTNRIRTDRAGVGLGLAIVKSITQAHDGTLTLMPRATGGLCVTVQLPAAPPHSDMSVAAR